MSAHIGKDSKARQVDPIKASRICLKWKKKIAALSITHKSIMMIYIINIGRFPTR